MRPKEKAKDIFDKMIYHIMYNCQPTLSEMVAKQCALIAVDEMLDLRNNLYVNEGSLLHQYLLNVKKEIELL
jgi:hypothetical protein